METIKRSSITLIFFAVFMSLLIVSCSSNSPPPTEWFNEGLDLDEHDFPPGVDFGVVRKESVECLHYSDSIIVSNSSSTPVYIEATSYWSGSKGDRDVPCPEDNLCLKVVSNQAWDWDVINIGEDPPWDFDWVLVDKSGNSENLELWTTDTGLTASGYHIQVFESRNREGYGGDMPEDLSVPESQYFELPYMYDNEEFRIGVTLSYTINECYSSERTVDVESPYKQTAFCFISFLIIGIIAFVFILISILKRIKRNTKNRVEIEDMEHSE